MERLRSVEVVVTAETNKQTFYRTLEMHEDESLDEFAERVKETINAAVAL